MRVATWNVNSVKQRLPRLLPWLDERKPDVVCLQETKLADAAFDELLGEELTARGYAIARHGEAQWNGVAILSRVGLEEVAALRDVVSGIDAALVCGDMNVAPTDADVFDPDAYAGQTHVTAPERAALSEASTRSIRMPRS